MRENFVFIVIFETYDVMYNGPISLLPPIVLDYLFAFTAAHGEATIELSILNSGQWAWCRRQEKKRICQAKAKIELIVKKNQNQEV